MAEPEHFETKNSTVIEYTLGYKNKAQNNYIKSSRSKNSFIDNKSSFLRDNQATSPISVSTYQNSNLISNSSNTIIRKIFNPLKVSNKYCQVLIVTVTTIILILVAALIAYSLVYFGVFFKRPGYQQTCSTSNPCEVDKNFICNGTCTCDSTKYWTGFICNSLEPFGNQCSGDYQCSYGLNCINSVCQCTSSYYFDGTVCQYKLSYGLTCSPCIYNCLKCNACNQCNDNQTLYCNATNFKCICKSPYYYDSFNQLCLSYGGYNTACLYNIDCNSTAGKLFREKDEIPSILDDFIKFKV